MDMYGVSAPVDFFPVDELLDFSNDELFSAATTHPTDSDFPHHHLHHQFPLSETPSPTIHFPSSDFSDQLYVPNDDVAELEWLSNFVDDSFSDFPANSITAGSENFRSDTPFHGRSRSKRSRTTSSIINGNWTSSPGSDSPPPTMDSCKSAKASAKRGGNSSREPPVGRKCTHCASEKTPQWRTGPLGPKTLCNACGVRFKSGRLVPEYRPAASPTFVLTQHSNSHRKVLELRRQKELLPEIQREDFGVC